MIERCRSEEMAVPLEYITQVNTYYIAFKVYLSSLIILIFLNQVHESYEQWLMHTPPEKLPAPILIIDVDQSLEDVVKSYKKHQRQIFGS